MICNRKILDNMPRPRTCAKCGLGPCKDGTQILSEMSGVAAAEISELWQQVKDNSKRLNDCKRHLFSAETVKPGDKLTCANCQGEMQLGQVGSYIRGYQASGGTATDIWPAWK